MKWFETDAAEKQLEWWIDMLAPLAAQPVPLRAYGTEEVPAAFVRLEARIGSTAHAGLHDISRRRRVPLLAVVFAAFASVIARRLELPHVSALSLVGGRTLPGANRAVGAFYNSIVLSLDTERIDEDDLLRGAARAFTEDVILVAMLNDRPLQSLSTTPAQRAKSSDELCRPRAL